MEQVYIGPGHALDPAKYFIVVVNQIGGGLSTSPHNSSGALADPRFPKVRIADDVRAQHALLTKHFGLKWLALVVGGSMGAQQTCEWAVRYPEMVRRAAAIAGTAKNTEHDFLFTETLVDAITTDPGFQGGNYSSPDDVAAGLKRHAKMWTAAWLGLVPAHTGSGGRTRILGVSKRGDKYLRTLLVHGARSVLACNKNRSPWLEQLALRRPFNVVVLALANKMARTIWAVLRHERSYQSDWVSCAPMR